MSRTDENVRCSGFELMRLVAMFMIVLGHCALSTAQNVKPYLGVMDNIGWLIKAFTVPAVNLFFLLTGFFLGKRSSQYSKVVQVWGKTFLYSVIIYVVIACLDGNLDFRSMVSYFAPITTKKYWFMQTYIAIVLLAPYFSLVLENLDIKKHCVLSFILICLFCVHPTFVKAALTLDGSQGYGIIWGATLLIIGNLLHKLAKEGIFDRIPSTILLCSYFAISFLIYVSNYIIVKYNIAQGIDSRSNFYAYNSISVFLQSVCLFLFFYKLSEKKTVIPAFNWAAKNALAVYLIGGHPLLLGRFWIEYINMSKWWNEPVIYILIAIAASTALVLSCILIDKLIDILWKQARRITYRYEE